MSKIVQLQTLRLCCDKVTDGFSVFDVDDEVIIYVAAVCSDVSRSFVKRYPSDSGHLDMNDGDEGTNKPKGPSHCINDEFFLENIFKRTVNPGEKWEISILVVEEDGGTTKTEQEILAFILKQIGDPISVTAGHILSIITSLNIFAVDKNDFIGTFDVTVRAELDGAIASGYTKGKNNSFWESDARHLLCRLNGDGSNYLAEFELIF